MNISITGANRGIGHQVAVRFQEMGHSVTDFSRSSGYDITVPADRDRIIDVAENHDIFINNAHSSMAQVDLLFLMCERWKDQKKIIVNIGSSITMRWETTPHNLRYRNDKMALNDACEMLWNKFAWPRIMCFHPCATDTPRNSSRPGPKAAVEHMAEFLIFCITNPNFRVQHIGLAVNPADAD
jgi:NAD(P)-dependent dehydrogenase (short-subunit alcohol dehydrogenase family)